MRTSVRGDLAEDHDHTSLGGGLTGDTSQRVLADDGIEHSVRDLVTDLVYRSCISRG